MKRVIAIVLCLVSMFLLSSCASQEEAFCDIYVEYALDIVREDSKIDSISISKDAIVGELATINIKEQKKGGYYQIETYYLVLNDIVFTASEIELKFYEVELFKDTVKQYNGETVEKGYFSKSYELGNAGYTTKYDVLMGWKLLQVENDHETEYDIDKINEIIG